MNNASQTSPACPQMDMAEASLPVVLDGHWSTEDGRDMAAHYAAMTRAELGSAHENDFALANSIFLADRWDLGLIGHQTAAKERIRWLSVQLALAEAELRRRDEALASCDLRGIALNAMRDTIRTGESNEMCARWIAERVRAAIDTSQQPQASPGNRKDGEAQS